LPRIACPTGAFSFSAQREHLVMRPGDAPSTEQRHPPCLVDELGELFDHRLRRAGPRPLVEAVGVLEVRTARRLARHVTGQGHDRNATTAQGVLDCYLGHPGHLLWPGDHPAVVAAVGEQQGGVGLLEVPGAELGTRDVGGQREDRSMTPVRVVQAVDEVDVPRPGAAGAGAEPAGELRFGAGGEGAGLLMAHMYPVDADVAANGVGDRVEGIAHDSVHRTYTGGEQDLDELVGHCASGHDDHLQQQMV
jgi:hypothetical protein